MTEDALYDLVQNNGLGKVLTELAEIVKVNVRFSEDKRIVSNLLELSRSIAVINFDERL
ncbi:MAG: hypothetical protein WC783_02640 [Candidatus Paceibacterota bacterium]|jgi:hypothetical protein